MTRAMAVAAGEKREARSEKREARGEKRGARGEKREARSERREARSESEVFCRIAKNLLLCAAAGGFRALKSVVIVGDGSLSSVLSWLPARHEPKLTAWMDHNDALEVGHLPFMAAPVHI